jgi:Major Facilitator Superfamily
MAVANGLPRWSSPLRCEGRERTRAIAVWGSAGASGLSLGVLAGGVLTGLFGWPAVFFVNVPIVVALLALAPLVLPGGRPSSAARRFDVPGALLVTLGAMAIVDTLVQAPTVGWASTRTLLEAAAGLLLLSLFVAVERRTASPLMPPRLLRARTVRGGVLVTAAFMSSFGLQLFFLTLYLQQVLGEDPLQAGLRFLPLVLSVVVGTQSASPARHATRPGSGRSAPPSDSCTPCTIGSAAEQAGEHGRFADLGLPGRGEQRQLPIACKSAQVRQCLRPPGILQLPPVAAGEFLEAVRVVAVPLAQLVRRRDVFAPLIERRLGLGQPSRPDPVDQHPGAVARLRLLIHPAYPDCSSRHRLPPHCEVPPLGG